MGRTCDAEGDTEVCLLYHDEKGRFLWEDHNYRPWIGIGDITEGEGGDGEIYVVVKIVEKYKTKGYVMKEIYLKSIGTTQIDHDHEVSVVQFYIQGDEKYSPVTTKKGWLPLDK